MFDSLGACLRSTTSPRQCFLLFALGFGLLISSPRSALADAELVGDLVPGISGSSWPHFFSTVGDRIYFQVDGPDPSGQTASLDLWVSDGTSAGTSVLLEDVRDLAFHLDKGAVVGSTFYFTGLEGDILGRIYRVEGNGPVEELGLEANPFGSSADGLAFVETDAVGEAVFYTRETVIGLELWRLDPSAAAPTGTFVTVLAPSIPVSDGKSAISLGDFVNLYPWGNRLAAFVVEDTNGDLDVDLEDEEWLWLSDGTAEGTERIARVRHTELRSLPFVAREDRLFFVGPEEDDPRGEVWVSDGTASGTGRVADLVPGLDDTYFSGLVADENAAYFHGRSSGEAGFRVWRTDGTAEGTYRLSERQTEHPIAVVGDTVYATLREDDGSFGLYRFVAGLPREQRVSSVAPAAIGNGPGSVIAAGDRLYYSTNIAGTSAESSFALYSTDGTSAGTRLEGQWPMAPADEAPEELAVLGSKVLFTADDGISGRELWSVDLHCEPSPETQCVGNGRFQLGSSWFLDLDTQDTPVADAGKGLDLTADTGGFTFFDSQNVELAVKVLDGSSINAHFWVFLGSLSNVSFRLDVVDTATGQSRTYRNPDGTFASFGDIEALPVSGAVGGSVDPDTPKYGAPKYGATNSGGALLPLVRSIPGNGEKREPCVPSAEVLCLDDGLDDGRFRLTATWKDFEGTEGTAQARDLTRDTGGFWFFDPANVELLVKVIDARLINAHFWVFLGSLSNVAFTLEVEDTRTGTKTIYENQPGQFASFGDVEALPD